MVFTSVLYFVTALQYVWAAVLSWRGAVWNLDSFGLASAAMLSTSVVYRVAARGHSDTVKITVSALINSASLGQGHVGNNVVIVSVLGLFS